VSNTAPDRLCAFVLEKSIGEPLARRAAIYRDLALILAKGSKAREFLQMAKDLEQVERRHQQLLLDLGIIS